MLYTGRIHLRTKRHFNLHFHLTVILTFIQRRHLQKIFLRRDSQNVINIPINLTRDLEIRS